MSKRLTLTLADGVYDALEKASKKLGKETGTLGRELLEDRMIELGMLDRRLKE